MLTLPCLETELSQRCLRRDLYLDNLMESLLEDGGWCFKEMLILFKISLFVTMTPITWDKSNRLQGQVHTTIQEEKTLQK